MNTLFAGLAVSLGYGVFSTAWVYLHDGQVDAQLFFAAYTTSFKTLFSFGLILGTALIVYRFQHLIPRTIEDAFSVGQLEATQYQFHKQRFSSRRRSMEFAAQFIVIGFVIFWYCQFPLRPLGNALMVAAGCAQYGLGVYIGRKLFYAGMMLHALLTVPVNRNLFKGRELDLIDSFVHVASTLTVVFVYLHVAGYYSGPFKFGSILGLGIKPFLILPAIIATPVLLVFTFYPRSVLRRVYNDSIDLEISRLQTVLQNEELTSFERRSYLIEVDKMSRDELRYSLQLTLADLPVGIAVLVMVLEPLIKG